MSTLASPGSLFSFRDFERECDIEYGCHVLDGKSIGIKVYVPQDLQREKPFNLTAYHYLQYFRQEIFEYGTMEFPGLPLNPCNYTLAQSAPWQHGYSSNPYMTDYCQQPHQDTPPYPTAFWLAAPRRFFATCFMFSFV